MPEITFVSRQAKHKQILALCDAIRNSHPDMEYLYTQGQCYNFALILRTQFPGEIWYDQIEGHVYYKVDDVWYDVRGRHYKIGETASRLEHRDGHRPHRWGLGDRRRLEPPMTKPLDKPMTERKLDELMEKQKQRPNERGMDALLGDKKQEQNKTDKS
jgi:hypothetical protein